jgi:hypothetical protein
MRASRLKGLSIRRNHPHNEMMTFAASELQLAFRPFSGAIRLRRQFPKPAISGYYIIYEKIAVPMGANSGLAALPLCAFLD